MMFTITSKSGAEMGSFEGATPAEALVAMHRAAGYGRVDYDIDGDCIAWPDHETAALCGDVDAWEIRESEYAGALITVEVGRHTIDPQGLASDEEAEACEAHILDAVREAFPGADVRAVGLGGRTGGCMSDGREFDGEVRDVVNEAFNSFMSG